MESRQRCFSSKIIMRKLSQSMRQDASGFSLVELIITLVILGILSAVIMPRFLGSTTFNAPIIRDQVVALARIAQQSALGRDSVNLTIQPNAGGSNATITVSYDSPEVEIESASFPISDVSLTTDNTTASCSPGGAGNSITNANPLNLNFGELGDLGDSGISGSEAAVSSALRICINNEPALSVCVSPSGFAYVGDCDD